MHCINSLLHSLATGLLVTFQRCFELKQEDEVKKTSTTVSSCSELDHGEPQYFLQESSSTGNDAATVGEHVSVVGEAEKEYIGNSTLHQELEASFHRGSQSFTAPSEVEEETSAFGSKRAFPDLNEADALPESLPTSKAQRLANFTGAILGAHSDPPVRKARVSVRTQSDSTTVRRCTVWFFVLCFHVAICVKHWVFLMVASDFWCQCYFLVY